MRSEFKQFSDAARLYAKNVEIVREMERLFLNDVDSFLDSVRERMQANLEVGKIGERKTGEYRSWWIEDEHTSEEDYVPYLWIKRKNIETIIPGALTLIADFDESTDEEKRRFSACRTSLELKLPEHCEVLDRGIFGVRISYGDTHAVEQVAAPILSILAELHRVETEVFAARAKRAPRRKSKIIR